MFSQEKLQDAQQLDGKLYSRLFGEALDDIGEDKLKHGPKALHDYMYKYMLKDGHIRFYKIDDYIVGLDCYHIERVAGYDCFYFRFPLIGKDKNGSKAWWYEHLDEIVDYYRSEEVDAVFYEHSPGSPVSDGAKLLITGRPDLWDVDNIQEKRMEEFSDKPNPDNKWGYLAPLLKQE